MSVRTARRRMVLGAILATLGAVAIGALVRHVGVDAVLAAVARAARFIPCLLVLEGCRIGCDAGAAMTLARRGGRRVPLAPIVRAQLIGYTIAAFTPAGRAAAEAVKAAVLAKPLGAARAAAIGTINQSVMLMVTGAVSIPCAAAAWATTGASPLTLVMVLHAAGTIGVGLALQLGARQLGSHRFGAWIGRRFARIGRAAEGYRRELEAFPVLPRGPLVAYVLHRALQVTEYAVLLVAVGMPSDLRAALVANGVYAAASAVGDLVPGQLGATDGAFTLAAPALGGSAASGVAIALLVHLLQLAWAVLGGVAAIAWPPGGSTTRAEGARAGA